MDVSKQIARLELEQGIYWQGMAALVASGSTTPRRRETSGVGVADAVSGKPGEVWNGRFVGFQDLGGPVCPVTLV